MARWIRVAGVPFRTDLWAGVPPPSPFLPYCRTAADCRNLSDIIFVGPNGYRFDDIDPTWLIGRVFRAIDLADRQRDSRQINRSLQRVGGAKYDWRTSVMDALFRQGLDKYFRAYASRVAHRYTQYSSVSHSPGRLSSLSYQPLNSCS